MLGERLHIEADGLLAGEGIEIAADRIHFAGYVLSGTGARSLEHHVLNEVRDAVGLSRLAAGAGLDPDAHCHRTQVFHPFGENNQAIRQYGAAKVSLSVHSHSIIFDCGLLRPFSGARLSCFEELMPLA